MQQSIRTFCCKQDTRERAAPAALPAAAECSASRGDSPHQFTRKRKRVEGGQEPRTAEETQDPDAQSREPGLEAAISPSGSAERPGGGGKARQLTQMYLDVGQRDFHSKRCPTCGMVFTPGDAGDERLHASFHSNATKGLRYHAAQSDKPVGVDGTRGKLVLVDGGIQAKRVLALVAFLEEQMGLAEGWLLAVPSAFYLYISSSTRHILGCAVTETISEACQVVPARPEGLLSCNSAAQPAPPACDGVSSKAGAVAVPAGPASGPLSALGGREPAREGGPDGKDSVAVDRSHHVKALCGVRLMWTSVDARRQGVATKLLDCARSHAIHGYVVPRSSVAFTQPTADGRAFVQHYTKTVQYLVY